MKANDQSRPCHAIVMIYYKVGLASDRERDVVGPKNIGALRSLNIGILRFKITYRPRQSARKEGIRCLKL